MESPPSPDPKSHEKSPNSSHNLDGLWNLMTLIVLVVTLIAIVFIVVIYSYPASPLNPLRHPTLIPTLFIPSRTPSPIVQSPSPIATSVVAATSIPRPTEPSIPTPTVAQATPGSPLTSQTPTSTVRSSSIYSFVLQAEPRAINATLFNPGRGCNWMGVAGQAFDLKNSPVPLGIIVQVAGVIDGKGFSITSLTGTATQYGTAGYEVTLSDKLVATKGQLWIRLLDQAGLAISDRVYFDTFADCNQNLILINFKQVK